MVSEASTQHKTSTDSRHVQGISFYILRLFQISLTEVASQSSDHHTSFIVHHHQFSTMLAYAAFTVAWMACLMHANGAATKSKRASVFYIDDVRLSCHWEPAYRN
jgi:hypothetical protein